MDAATLAGVVEDYPAAHSMDTTWYAVDRAGHVARFDSGEEGAVPWAAHRATWEELSDELVVARIAAATRGGPLDEQRILADARDAATNPDERRLVTAILGGDDAARDVYADWLLAHDRDGYDPRGRAVFEVGATMRVIPAASLPDVWSGVLAFTSEENLELFRAIHLDYAASSSHPVDPRLGLVHAISVVELHQYAFDDFWAERAIRAAFVVDRTLEAREVGLYELACSFSGPYRRRATPREPLLVADLPEPLRGRIGALVMDRFTFKNLDEIDPGGYFDCQNYR